MPRSKSERENVSKDDKTKPSKQAQPSKQAKTKSKAAEKRKAMEPKTPRSQSNAARQQTKVKRLTTSTTATTTTIENLEELYEDSLIPSRRTTIPAAWAVTALLRVLNGDSTDELVGILPVFGVKSSEKRQEWVRNDLKNDHNLPISFLDITMMIEEEAGKEAVNVFVIIDGRRNRITPEKWRRISINIVTAAASNAKEDGVQIKDAVVATFDLKFTTALAIPTAVEDWPCR